jgi:oligoendopeptidase F
VFDYLLFDQKVTREMYDRQIDLITEKLARTCAAMRG